MYTIPRTWAQLKEEAFFLLRSIFWSLVPVTLILICISIVNRQIFISSHSWMSILCHWHSLVRCDTVSLWHFSQTSATWTRRCIMADGFFLFHHCLFWYLLCHNSSEVDPTHIKSFPLVPFTHEQLTWKNQLVWICTIKVNSSSFYLLNCLHKLKHTNLFNHHLLCKLPPTNWYHHCLLYKLVLHIQICSIISK